MCDVVLWDVCGFFDTTVGPLKFGTHVRIDTLTLNKFDPPHPRGFRGLSIVKNLSRPTAPNFGTHMRIDTLTLKKKLTHPTPGGFRGLSIVTHILRRTAPKFGTHVRIDTLTLKKIDPPHPRGVWGLNCLARLALARERTPSYLQVMFAAEFIARGNHG